MKENDYVVRTWPSGMTTMGIAVYCNDSGKVIHDVLMFKALESYSYEGGVISGGIYGSMETKKAFTRHYLHRVATTPEIEVFKKFGTIQNMERDYRIVQLEKIEI
jgi:hypothetical protein